MHMGRRHAAGRDRGAAAVEGALLTAFVLVPLLLGVMQYGFYFWKAQKVELIDLDIPQQQITGIYCTEAALLQEVQNLLNGNLSTIAGNLDVPSSAVALTSSIVETLDVGVVVELSLDVDLLNGVTGLLPLPGVGNVVRETTVRLQNVRIDGTSC